MVERASVGAGADEDGEGVGVGGWLWDEFWFNSGFGLAFELGLKLAEGEEDGLRPELVKEPVLLFSNRTESAIMTSRVSSMTTPRKASGVRSKPR